jgi:hypothetical protein
MLEVTLTRHEADGDLTFPFATVAVGAAAFLRGAVAHGVAKVLREPSLDLLAGASLEFCLQNGLGTLLIAALLLGGAQPAIQNFLVIFQHRFPLRFVAGVNNALGEMMGPAVLSILPGIIRKAGAGFSRRMWRFSSSINPYLFS